MNSSSEYNTPYTHLCVCVRAYIYTYIFIHVYTNASTLILFAFFPFSRSVSEKCSQVDSSATDALCRLLLDTLAYCSLLHNPETYTDAMAFPLKERIITIAIRQPQNNDAQD